MRIVFILALAFAVSSCGFEPVYQQKVQHLRASNITVNVVNQSRSGQLLRIALEDELANLPLAKVHYLTATLEETKQPIIVERDSRISRYNLVHKARYSLTDAQGETTLSQQQRQRISSYNVSDSDFATFAAEKDARRNGIHALAKLIAMDIASQLSQE